MDSMMTISPSELERLERKLAAAQLQAQAWRRAAEELEKVVEMPGFCQLLVEDALGDPGG